MRLRCRHPFRLGQEPSFLAPRQVGGGIREEGTKSSFMGLGESLTGRRDICAQQPVGGGGRSMNL